MRFHTLASLQYNRIFTYFIILISSLVSLLNNTITIIIGMMIKHPRILCLVFGIFIF
jgi:hypothetical protein